MGKTDSLETYCSCATLSWRRLVSLLYDYLTRDHVSANYNSRFDLRQCRVLLEVFLLALLRCSLLLNDELLDPDGGREGGTALTFGSNAWFPALSSIFTTYVLIKASVAGSLKGTFATSFERALFLTIWATTASKASRTSLSSCRMSACRYSRGF